jgi:hypothetical protein
VATEFREETEAVLEETTALSDTWQEHTPTGLQRAMLTQSGFFDDGSDSINAALSGNQQTSRVVCYALEGNTIGKKVTGLTGAFGATYARISSRNELHKANADYTVTGQKDTDGVILHALSAETATGNTEGANSQDNGASSANGAAGYLQVTAISGTGATLDAVIRHSADDVTYANLISFAQVVLADARKAERKTVAGTVNRHTAASWTIAGTSPSVTFMVGVKRL